MYPSHLQAGGEPALVDIRCLQCQDGRTGDFAGSKTFLDMYCLSSQHGLVEFQSVGNWGAKIHPSGSADKLLQEDPNYSFP